MPSLFWLTVSITKVKDKACINVHDSFNQLSRHSCFNYLMFSLAVVYNQFCIIFFSSSKLVLSIPYVLLLAFLIICLFFEKSDCNFEKNSQSVPKLMTEKREYIKTDKTERKHIPRKGYKKNHINNVEEGNC